jgi:predicted dehydrogenase
MRLAVVGCGRIAQDHLRALGQVPELALAAACDTRKEAATTVAELHGCPGFDDLETMLAAVRPDGVLICTPPADHFRIADRCLSAGIHVLCEKPLCLSVADAEALAGRAGDVGRVLMMASKFRYVKDLIAGKAIAASGILGTIVLFENVFCSRVDMSARWNSKRAAAGGGVLIDNGCHSVDIARYLLGPVRKVQAQFGRQVQEIEVEDTARLYMLTGDGTMGTSDLSWSLHKESESFVSVYGTEGTLQVGWQRSRYRQSEKQNWVVFGSGYSKDAALAGQLRNFARSARGQEAPLITADDAVASVRVIEAAYRSAGTDKWLDV